MAALLLAGCSGTSTDESAGPPRPGAAGVHDPYFPHAGNGGIDVQHYGLDLTYTPRAADAPGEQPPGGKLVATARITVEATRSLSRFDLDLRGLTVRSVRVDDAAARFSRKGSELRITPARPIPRGTRFTAVVRYVGEPHPLKSSPLGRYGWLPTRDGAFVASEPNGAKTWFPSNDHPSDKATFDIRISVPDKLTALSNGTLASRKKHDGRAVYSWRMRHPMATYLATATIGRFDVKRGSTPGGIPIIVATDTHHDDRLDELYAETAKITDAWTKEFGRYPFATTGGVYDDVDAPYALENQTRSLYGFTPDPEVIAHELAHQWFGDSVTPRTWRDIWLSEGFATYAEWLWEQRSGGRPLERTFDEEFAAPASDQRWRVPPAKPGEDRIFAHPVYVRGGLTLLALREKIGADTFRRLLRTWARRHAYGTVTTQDFIHLAERVSGHELGGFFKMWLYTPTKPHDW